MQDTGLVDLFQVNSVRFSSNVSYEVGDDFVKFFVGNGLRHECPFPYGVQHVRVDDRLELYLDGKDREIIGFKVYDRQRVGQQEEGTNG